MAAFSQLSWQWQKLINKNQPEPGKRGRSPGRYW